MTTSSTLPSANHIAYDPNFVISAIEEYPDYLQSKEYFIKLATWYAKRWESIDIEIVKLAYLRLLDNAIGVNLDNIGALLGVDRYDQDDDSYRALIKFRSARQTSNATRPDVVSLLTKLFYGDTPIIYKGVQGFIEVTVPKACFDYSTLSSEMESLFPITTNLWVIENTNSFPLVLVDQKTGVQPSGTGGLSDQKISDTNGILSNWIHSSAITVKL